MSRYILHTAHKLDLTRKIEALPASTYQIDATTWAIRSGSGRGSQFISETLFPRREGKPTEHHIIIRFEHYWGHHNKALWEFLDSEDE